MGDRKNNTDDVILKSKFILEQASTWSITSALRFSALHRAVGIEYSYCTWVEVRYNRSKS